MLLGTLGLLAALLTAIMFITRNMMLGFPSAIFWFLFGADAYLLSTVPWGDIYFYIAFASCFGMTTFSMYAAYGLREKPDAVMEGDVEGAVEPGGAPESESKPREGDTIPDGGDEFDTRPEPSRRVQNLRERAARRRTGQGKRPSSWGEFK